MKNIYSFFLGKIWLLFSILVMLLLTGSGCVNLGIEDVTNQEPYSQFVGKKYRLSCNCYLAISSTNPEIYNEDVNDGNEFIKDCYKQKNFNVASERNIKSKIENSDYYIVACGWNGSPCELNEKYIGTAVWGGTIVGILPKGSEFIIKKIILFHADRRLIFTSPYVEITADKIIADAFLLVRGDPSNLVFEKRYVEMVDPEPEKK
jgi:hypothetical protein